MIGSTAGGTMLPLQTIWGGKTLASLPSRTALRRDEADKNGFSYGHGDTRHWSSLETTKEVIKFTSITCQGYWLIVVL